MNNFSGHLFITFLLFTFLFTACSKDKPSDDEQPEETGYHTPLEDTFNGPKAGNPDGTATISDDAKEVNIETVDYVIGDGTPESCTCEEVIKAVKNGGNIVFDCGEDPIKIDMTEPAKVYNNAKKYVVIDGGGLVTLSGRGKNRILYMNTCDSDLVWTTDHCNNQDHPQLVLQNITLADGNSVNETEYTGGGAVWIRGGRAKFVNCAFYNNRCASTGPDVGGGAIRVFDQYEDKPVYVVNCTFGGAEGYGNIGSNGGALSSIGVSWTIFNSVLSHNEAIGNGGNPAKENTPGGGSGGAIYNDGNKMTLTIKGSVITENTVNAYGSAIFFVTNNHTGNIIIDNSSITNNNGGSWYPVYPQISMHSDTDISVVNTTIE